MLISFLIEVSVFDSKISTGPDERIDSILKDDRRLKINFNIGLTSIALMKRFFIISTIE